MKLAILFILTFSFLLSNPITDVLKYYESQEKKIILEIQEIPKSQRMGEDLKLAKRTYYKLIPPKFKTEIRTYKSFDPDKWTKEMEAHFGLVDEQIMIKQDGYTWTLNQNEEEPSLVFESFPGEFMTIKKVVIESKHGGSTVEFRKHLPEVKEQIEHGYQTLRKKINVRVADGTIQEISKKEYKSIDDESRKFSLKKGSWRVVESK